MCGFFFLVAFCSVSLFGKESIILRSKPHGMFSMFHFVLYYLQEYERGTIDGLKVDFAKTGLYYEESAGLNWWEYYFEPIILENQNAWNSINIIEEDTYVDPNCIEFSNSLEDNHHLVEKYIKIKRQILQKIDDFQKENFEDKFVIGVHYRGTDKVHYEAPSVAYSNVMESIYKVIDQI